MEAKLAQTNHSGSIMKTAIVTGATRGIGREIVLTLAKENISVVACYHKRHDLAELLKEDLAKINADYRLVAGDISNPHVLNTIIETCISSYGGIHYLVNNAGIFERRTIEAISRNDFDCCLDINLKAPFFLIKGCIPYMKSQGYGKIVNISSTLAYSGYSYGAHYTCAKAGIIGLTKSLAVELAPEINVNGVVPGFIETTNLSEDSSGRRAERLKMIPKNRIGCPEDIAKVVAYLLSDHADYITGELINVSGGLYI